MDSCYGPKILCSFKMYMFKGLFWIEQVKALIKTRKKLIYAAQDAMFLATPWKCKFRISLKRKDADYCF